jgi:hypothetical protein
MKKRSNLRALGFATDEMRTERRRRLGIQSREKFLRFPAPFVARDLINVLGSPLL